MRSRKSGPRSTGSDDWQPLDRKIAAIRAALGEALRRIKRISGLADDFGYKPSDSRANRHRISDNPDASGKDSGGIIEHFPDRFL
jgi:hypothetical protein